MPDVSYVADLVLPAGNGAQSFNSIDAPLGDSSVRRILLTFPPGCAGLVGVVIFAGGSVAYPINGDKYFVFDDYTYVLEAKGQITSGQWKVVGYNTDYYQHTIQVIFEYDYLIQGPALPSGLPVSI
jgi:hypothetical protein